MIIAVDFDGTLVTDEYPNIGVPKEEIVQSLKEHKEAGDKIILWTCRTGAALIEAVDFCRWELDLVFDAVNDNLPEKIAEHGCNCRKVYADEYWDDKSIPILEPDSLTYKMYNPLKAYVCAVEEFDGNKKYQRVFAETAEEARTKLINMNPHSYVSQAEPFRDFKKENKC